MGRDHKRKRESNGEDDSIQPPSKAQIIENGQHAPKPVKDAGQRRQEKSERRKKTTSDSKKKPRPQSPPAVPEPIIEENAADGDPLSTGKDFVSLGGSGGPNNNKDKRRSPRSIRKEAREIKAQTSSGAIEEGSASKGATNPTSAAPARFICFVGNLPYTATTEQIKAHFSKLQPKSIRLSTDKKTGKSKGFAFLEFDNYDKMKTCLKLYHHSIFDEEQTSKYGEKKSGPNQDSKSKGRKINVELTAGGGGGKSAGRRDKIKAKNMKLDEERVRDWEKKREEEAKQTKGSRPARNSYPASGANSENMSKGDIHPSRLSRVHG